MKFLKKIGVYSKKAFKILSKTNHNKIKGVDLGCVWGGSLAAININDKSIITVDSVK